MCDSIEDVCDLVKSMYVRHVDISQNTFMKVLYYNYYNYYIIQEVLFDLKNYMCMSLSTISSV